MTRTDNPSLPTSFPIRGWLAECSAEFRHEFLRVPGDDLRAVADSS
jgi:hypothetical protein